MKTFAQIIVKSLSKVPKNFTGIAEYSDGTKTWYLNGILHRTDGPAIESFNGDKYWYLNGEEYSEEEWKKLRKT